LIILASRNLISLALHRPVAAMTYATSSVSDFGDSVWLLVCSRTCETATTLRDACISDLGLSASRFFVLNPVFRVIDQPERSSFRCWL